MTAPRIVPSASSGPVNKIVTARDAVRLIRSGDTVAIGGFGGVGFAEEIIHAIADAHAAADQEVAAFGRPSDLTLFFGVGQGRAAEGRGVNRLSQPGLVKRVIGAHFNFIPAIQQLVIGNQVEAYNLPLGTICHLYRDIAAGKPGHVSRIGLGTFVDPRLGGGKLNAKTTEDLVRLMEIDGQEYLFYKTVPIHVGIIRGTTADPNGNITLEREALTNETLSLAMAAHNSGGLVIAQVERIAEANTLNPRQVKIPGVLVDCIVVATDPKSQWQTSITPYNPAYAGEMRVPMTSLAPLEMSERKVIARRAAMELRPNSVVNLGVGMPEGVAAVVAEEKASDLMTLTAEPGVIGGVPAGGRDFGAATNAQAVIDMPYQFDFYDGGGLDVAFLGLAQADREGNINVSKFGARLAGAGGFIDISSNATKGVFCGTHTAGDLEVSIAHGKVLIERDGKHKKFIEQVEHRTFSGPVAAQNDKEVLYVTERAVFRLTREGLELTEVAPGVDIERDIIDKMAFKPIVREPRLMDARIFSPEPMGLRDDLLRLPFEARFAYDEERNTLFMNFSEERVTSQEIIDRYCDKIRAMVEPLGHKVYAVVNYDGWEVTRELEDSYLDAVKAMGEKYFLGVTRFTTSAFMRAKLGERLDSRGVAPHIFESEDDATEAVRETLGHEG